MSRFLLSLSFFLFLFLPSLSARSWAVIHASGKLRVLTVDANREAVRSSGLHRVMMPIDREQAILRGFARSSGLTVEYVRVSTFKDLFPALLAGKGDLISANLAETPEREKEYLLSEPFDFTREVVFTAESSPLKGSSPNALRGYTGRLLPGTTYAENFRKFTDGVQGITVRDFPSTITHDDLIENVASGRITYSVLNECDLDAWLAYRTGIRKLFAVQSNVRLVFAARKDSGELIGHLNAYIRQVREPGRGTVSAADADKTVQGLPAGDLDVIRKRGYIRMLTSNDLFCCYLHGGAIQGFEYELAKRFADSLDVTLITVIPPDFKDLPRWLEEGKGDFIAANYTRTPDRIRNNPGMTFCAPYCGVTQVLIGRPSEKITRPEELAGRKVFVRKGNSYYDTLLSIRQKGIPVQIVPIPGEEPTLVTIQKVAEGTYDLTVADHTFLQLALNGGCKVRRILDLTGEQPFSWVVRARTPKLAAAVNEFFRKENRSTFFNLAKKRYYGVKQAQKVVRILFRERGVAVSPYDSIFRKYGQKYDFPWYFLAAQSYQESRFKADRVNHIGATGLMQVRGSTAKELGIGNLTDPDNGVHAGAKYMAKLRNRFNAAEISPDDRLCFALASYNAGYGHVRDARILASQLGLNPNVWFRNTEKALALLETGKYASRAKFGYCRASETIPYVSNIMLYTYQYRELLNSAELKKKTLGNTGLPPKRK